MSAILGVQELRRSELTRGLQLGRFLVRCIERARPV
jgi:hypothetical protein